MRSAITFLGLTWKWFIFAKGGFLNSLRDNLGVGLLALGLSTSLWVFVINEQNPPREGTFGDLIKVDPVNVPTGLDILEDIERVSVRISAPEDRWRSISDETFEATVNLSELGPGQHDVPVRVHSRDSRVTVKGVFPNKVSVELDPIRSLVVPVQVNIMEGPPTGYSVSKIDVLFKEVTVSGPTRLVDLVDSAYANVNLKGLKSDFRQVVPLVPRTDRGYDVERVRVAPPSVTVDIPIIREISFVELPVLPEVTGAPQSGYWVSSTSVAPTTITVVGPREVLQTMSFVKTQPVNINGATTDVAQNVNLVLPNEVFPLASSQPIRVQVIVAPTEGVRPFQITPSVVGLPAGRTATVEPVEVTLAGLLPTLSRLTASQISVTVDASRLVPGSHEVDPNVIVPTGLAVVGSSPNKVKVTIK